MKIKVNTEILSKHNSEFLTEYFELLISRLTHSNMSLEKDLGDPNYHKNAIRLRDNMRAFKVLIGLLEQELDEYKLINIGNIINETSPFISNGYRTTGDFIAETDIPISNPNNIHQDILTLLDNYYNKWNNLEPFEREARFHIDFIRIHPFEDGNGRTGRLVLNYNLIKQGIAPIIITNDLKEYYEEYIKNKDVNRLAKLLKIQSIKELEIINYLFEEYQYEKSSLPQSLRPHK